MSDKTDADYKEDKLNRKYRVDKKTRIIQEQIEEYDEELDELGIRIKKMNRRS
jgi:hypothetical protein